MTRWCNCCERDVDASQFMPVRRGWKCVYCNSCAASNMARYWAESASVGNVADLALNARE